MAGFCETSLKVNFFLTISEKCTLFCSSSLNSRLIASQEGDLFLLQIELCFCENFVTNVKLTKMPLFKYQFSVAISLTLCLLSIIFFKAKVSGPPALGEKTAKASTPASRSAKFGGKEH
jgi:hypothetical protein